MKMIICVSQSGANSNLDYFHLNYFDLIYNDHCNLNYTYVT